MTVTATVQLNQKHMQFSYEHGIKFMITRFMQGW